MSIHPTAIVDPQANLGSGVSIGPYAIIESGVTLGDDCSVAGHAQLLGRVTLGDACHIGPGAVVGGLPQDISFNPAIQSGVSLGHGNEIREHVTIHRSTREGGVTRLGNENFLMVGSHVGHDCQIGDGNVLANQALLGGHVQLGNRSFLGGGTAVHQFVRMGDLVMFQGQAGCSLDIPPFTVSAGANTIAGLNSVGLRRAGFTPEERSEVKEIYRLFYRERISFKEALTKAEAQPWGPKASIFLAFMQGDSRKGICMRTGKRGSFGT